MALINCGNAYKQDISGCVDYLTFSLSTLDADESYYISFTYANGAVIQKDIHFNLAYAYVFGYEFDIDNDNLWNIGTGPVKVEIFKTGSCNAEVFTICENEYTSLTLNFMNINQDKDYAVVPCTCD